MENALKQGVILQGKVFRYRIERVLGQGTFGITYLAKVELAGALGTLDSDMYVAIKEFFMRDIGSREEETVTNESKGGLYEDYKRKFAREAHNLSRLKHPHIVKVLEAFEANNTVYYAMEYCGGDSLDALIAKRGGIPETEAKEIFQQIASALGFMHEHKMLHLDVKPSNVMLRNNGEAVLIDFGLSKQYTEDGEPESSTTLGGGTPGYAPIEQAHYQEGKGFPVTMDVYALGATLFKMLTGIRPPEASVILNTGFPAYELQKKKVSDETIVCVSKAMSPLVAQRYESVAAFASELYEKIRVPKASRRPSTKRRVMLALTGIVLVLLVVYLVSRREQQPDSPLRVLTDQVVGQFADTSENAQTMEQPMQEEFGVENYEVEDSFGKLLFRYTGAMRFGLPDGEGRAVYPDGREYVGCFVQGKRHDDQAKFVFSDGNEYEGSFIQDHLGSGILTSRQKDTYGTYFKGSFRNDKPYSGTWYDKNGEVISRITSGK